MDDSPLYLSVKEASEYAGVGIHYMYALLNSDNPPPHLRIGNIRKIQKSALAGYLESLQEVKA